MTGETKKAPHPESSQKLDDTTLEAVSGGATLTGRFSSEPQDNEYELQKATQSPFRVSGNNISFLNPHT